MFSKKKSRTTQNTSHSHRTKSYYQFILFKPTHALFLKHIHI